jgi:hypothetical protein
MYLIHEHSSYTSAIDKYWVFNNKAEALCFYKSLVLGYGIQPDPRLDQDDSDLDLSDFVALSEDDYIVLCTMNSGGFARRP